MLTKNFRPYDYTRLAADYSCIVVRAPMALHAGNTQGLVELKPDHCMIGSVYVYTVGIACLAVQRAYSRTGERAAAR